MDNRVDIYRDYGNPPKIPEEFRLVESSIWSNGVHVERFEDNAGNFVTVVVRVPEEEVYVTDGITKENGERVFYNKFRVEWNIGEDIVKIIGKAKNNYARISMRYGSK